MSTSSQTPVAVSRSDRDAPFSLISDNRITFEVWWARLAKKLPAPIIEGRPEGVFVFVSDPDDLAEWFETAGGLVERGPVFAGMRPWTLTIDTGPECRGLVVHVSVLAMADAQVLHILVDAARLAVPLAQSPQAVA